MARLLIQKLIDEKSRNEHKSRRRIAVEAGVAPSTLHAWYHGNAKPTGKTVYVISQYFGRTFDEIMSPVLNGNHDDRREDYVMRIIIKKLRGESEYLKGKVLDYILDALDEERGK